MMRIAIFPAHGDSIASSRIRAHTLQKSLVEIGYDARIGPVPDAGVIVVQKRATPKMIEMVERARSLGVLIVFDVDDLGRELLYTTAPSALRRILHAADVVTTDTEGHREALLCDYGMTQAEVVPDAIDYYPSAPSPLPDLSSSPLRVLWFGNASNIALFERHARLLERARDVEVVAVTNLAKVKNLSARFPGVQFLPWSRQTFIEVLRSCAVSLLPHDGTDLDRAKSNNRMIASISWGVPAIVSRTPDYERTAKEAGIPQALFSNDEELLGAIEELRTPSARRAYLERAQPEIWHRYSPHAVAKRFLDVIANARRGPVAVTQISFFRWLQCTTHGSFGFALLREGMHAASHLIHGDPFVGNRS